MDTPAQDRLLLAIVRLTASLGRPPSVRELAADVDRNHGVVQRALERLRRCGLVWHKPKKSDWSLTGEGMEIYDFLSKED